MMYYSVARYVIIIFFSADKSWRKA